MITKVLIDNFKSLNAFELSCQRLTCLIGVNSSGKSAILQSIDFLSAIALGNVTDWLKARDWKAGDIRSRLRGRARLTIPFRLEFRIRGMQYYWSGLFNTNSLSCSSELVINTSRKDSPLLRLEKGQYRMESPARSVDFDYEGSILASLKEDILSDELREIRRFLRSIKSLELLNPLLLRKRARTTEDDLGLGGERLSAFLYSLSAERRKRIYGQMRHLFESLSSYSIRSKRSGWKELRILEQFGESPVETEARHISDGFLRILAIFSQLQTDHSVLLFDEIEDGLNHEVMEYLVDEILKSSQQVFFTTHSPMILNFMEDRTAEESVMLIYRDADSGETKACRFFDIRQIKEKLEYMGPGEVFANVDLGDLP
ncbi:MAG: AAA family ATPase [Thermodesulfobacteriota bacterium]